ncbi:tyrosine-type recombinase/integrase [Sphingomonas aurantiaca]|uniref:tyrosine-type recombinase/integrase n=1 Tax=Sphingomonas aurantiaca TaxID=185949 RepID=UPI003344745A
MSSAPIAGGLAIFGPAGPGGEAFISMQASSAFVVVDRRAQAVALLREVRAIMHQDDANMHGLIFDCGAGRMIGEKSIGTLYDRAGFEGRHVPHGWRATFSTLMNEKAQGADGDVVERALAHTPKDKVKAAYDRSAQLQRLRDLFQEWADLLVDI